MNTDKTLADVQPGGRVRLGDGPTIEKQARELLAKEWEKLSFDAPVEELREGCELPPVIAASVRAIVAALSAHPFPDGQRDNSDLLAGLRDVEEHLYCAGSNPSHTATVRAAINALSAQPSPGGQGDRLRYLTQHELDSIGSQAEGMDGEQWDRWVQAKFAEVNGLATVDSDGFTTLAARQPVGEPVAYTSSAQLMEIVERGDGFMWHKPGSTDIALYAAPPAQAVDLGQFRNAVELMEWQERGHANPDFPRGDAKKHAEALRLLALIDSHSAGGQP